MLRTRAVGSRQQKTPLVKQLSRQFEKRMPCVTPVRSAFFTILIQWACSLYLLYAIYRAMPGVDSILGVPIPQPSSEPVDVVITWVNGSDERFLQQLRFYDRGMKTRDDVNSGRRFAEKDELRYALRSIEKHMPWVRHVYIVTNGQVPSWLNLASEHVTVVPHEAIFANTSVLPTFSSPAIEANLFRVPGISRRFIYMNDDWLIGAPVEYSTFYTPTDGIIFYWHGDIGTCAHLCPWHRVNDGHCDYMCHVPECQMDGYDCIRPPGMPPPRKTRAEDFSAYELSIQSTQRALNSYFGFRTRKVMPHMPLLLDREAMAAAWKDFPLELTNTSSHRFRDGTDMQFEMFFTFYVHEKQTFVDLNEAVQEEDGNQDGVLDSIEIDQMIRKHYLSAPNENSVQRFRDTLQECYVHNQTEVIPVKALGECATLRRFLKNGLLKRVKFKHTLLSQVPSNSFYSLKSLKSNLAIVTDVLNTFRKFPRKFICLNDDLTYEPAMLEVNQQIYEELALFYRQLFPMQSKYELVDGQLNSDKYIQEYEEYDYRCAGCSVKGKSSFEWMESIAVFPSVAVVGSLIFVIQMRYCYYTRISKHS